MKKKTVANNVACRTITEMPGRHLAPDYQSHNRTYDTPSVTEAHADLAGRHLCLSPYSPAEIPAEAAWVMSELGAIVQTVFFWPVQTSPGLGVVIISGGWFNR